MLFFKDHQVRVFILVLSTAIILIFYFANSYINGSYLNKIVTVSFNTISIISGTGYISENFENWGNFLRESGKKDLRRWKKEDMIPTLNKLVEEYEKL